LPDTANGPNAATTPTAEWAHRPKRKSPRTLADTPERIEGGGRTRAHRL